MCVCVCVCVCVRACVLLVLSLRACVICLYACVFALRARYSQWSTAITKAEEISQSCSVQFKVVYMARKSP